MSRVLYNKPQEHITGVIKNNTNSLTLRLFVKNWNDKETASSQKEGKTSQTMRTYL